jgi:uncharacterized protein
MYTPIEFPSEGTTLRGRLYMPATGTPGPHPIVVMAPGLSATIRMTSDRYAEVFAAHGLAVLLYDHCSFGESGGEPRRHANPWVQARGYRDAVRFARTQPGIAGDRIGLWGTSFSGLQVLVLGALLDGIGAIAALVPACGDQPAPPDPDGRLFGLLRETFEHGEVAAATPETTLGPMPVVSWDPLRQPSVLAAPSAFRFLMEHGGRVGSGWVNDVTRVIPATPAPFSAGLAAAHVRAPVQVIYAPDDEVPRAAPVATRAVCDALPEPKEVIELEEGCGHFGHHWHPSPWFDRVVAPQAGFLMRHLAGRSGPEAVRGAGG